MALICKNISKKYSSHTVLDRVDIEININSISILIGPSGSGKTTLIKNLALIEKPDSGSINIENKIITFPSKKIEPIWPNITVVFQQLYLWPHLTLEENILLPIQNKKYNNEYLLELYSLFNMDKFIKRYPYQTSLGEQQRAAIVRALVLEPTYLLLDEITSSLDYEQANHILNLLIQAKKKTGLLLITHQIDFVKKLFENSSDNKIFFMDNGRIIESGGIEVINSPKSHRIQKFFSI